MSGPSFPTHTDGVLKRIALAVVVTVIVVSLGTWAYASHMDRQMDSAPLVEHLRSTPVLSEFTLIDEWAHDGDWLFKPHEPVAAKKYLVRRSVEDTCSMIDAFYGELGSELSAVSRSDDPDDWCGRRIRSNGETVHVAVQPARSWTQLPDAPPGTEFTEVLFQAQR